MIFKFSKKQKLNYRQIDIFPNLSKFPKEFYLTKVTQSSMKFFRNMNVAFLDDVALNTASQRYPKDQKSSR